jgi:SAM-dependent methyltransferase/ribosomal protein S18 acetylase RimI-like enzyme
MESGGPLFRYAEVDDAAAVADYHVRCWQTAYRGLISDEVIDAMTVAGMTERWREFFSADRRETGRRHVVALAGGRPVGHLSLGPCRDRSDDEQSTIGEVFALYVDPDHQRRGIGRELLRIGHRILRQQGFERSVLWTVVGNDPAIAFYRSAGWSLDGTTKEQPWGSGESTFSECRLSLELASTSSHVTENRSHWDEEATHYETAGERSWADPPRWGIFGLPDDDVGFLPDVEGLDVVELGCGTGYVSAWCLRAGARSAIGIDNSIAQLRTADRLCDQYDLRLPLVWGDAEYTPFADGSFDVAISEYGAAIWCDPYRWIPEAARLLRPGGILAFLGNSVISILAVNDFEAVPATSTLQRPQRDLHRVQWPDTDGVEFHISHGSMIRLLRTSGFEVLDLVELYADTDKSTTYDFLDARWASRWPHEEAWIARREG